MLAIRERFDAVRNVHGLRLAGLETAHLGTLTVCYISQTIIFTDHRRSAGLWQAWYIDALL